jgi:hypothetical protein
VVEGWCVLFPLKKFKEECPTRLSSVQPDMVQLVIGGELKCYKLVIVVDSGLCRHSVRGSIYSSENGRWSSPKDFTDC